MKFNNKNEFKSEDYMVDADTLLLERKKSSMPPIIVDLRSADDFESGHLIGAHSLPAEFLKDHLHQIPPYAPIIMYGDEDDSKTGDSAKLLRDNNFTDFKFVTGGFSGVIAAMKASDSEIFLADFPEDQWADKIEEVLTEKVRPALAADGGGLTVESIVGSKVTINYEGACHGCPSAKTGTLNFIKNSLSVSLNHEIEVEIA